MNCLPVNKKDDKHIEKNIEKEKNIHKTIEQKTPYNYFFSLSFKKTRTTESPRQTQLSQVQRKPESKPRV